MKQEKVTGLEEQDGEIKGEIETEETVKADGIEEKGQIAKTDEIEEKEEIVKKGDREETVIREEDTTETEDRKGSQLVEERGMSKENIVL